MGRGRACPDKVPPTGTRRCIVAVWEKRGEQRLRALREQDRPQSGLAIKRQPALWSVLFSQCSKSLFPPFLPYGNNTASCARGWHLIGTGAPSAHQDRLAPICKQLFSYGLQIG